MVGEFRYIKQVVGDAPHDLAHLGIGKVAVGQLLQVVKGVSAHIRFNARAHHMARVGHKVVGCAVNEPKHQIKRANAEDIAHRQAGKVVYAHIGDGTHDERQNQLAHRGERRTEQIEAEDALIAGHVGPEAAQQRRRGHRILLFFHDSPCVFSFECRAQRPNSVSRRWRSSQSFWERST